MLVPEPLVAAWAPYAVRAARRLASERRIDCVITTSPPESAHLVGHALAKRGIPWVADIRDAWNFEPLRPAFPTGRQRRLDERLERALALVGRRGDLVSRPAARTCGGGSASSACWSATPGTPSSRPSRPAPGPVLDPARTSLVYTGRFGSYGRDPARARRGDPRACARGARVAERLELVVAGPVTDDERRLLGADTSPARIALLGSVSRGAAVGLQRSADALLLLADPRRSQLVNLKLFEYLAAGRPIVALAAGTEAGRIVLETGAGEVVPSNDVEAIRGALRRLVAGELAAPDPETVRSHSYPAAAERMAAAVETAIRRAG